MNSILLKLNEKGDRHPVGSSKFLGLPDIWDGFVWPVNNDKEGFEYSLDFICQLNCEEVVPHDKTGLFPASGMLYFFYDLNELPCRDNDDSAARILYYGGERSALSRMSFTGFDLAYKEQSIDFSCGVGGLEGCRLFHRIPEKGKTPFLTLPSFETSDFEINIMANGFLCVYLEDDALKCRDFSNIFVSMHYPELAEV